MLCSLSFLEALVPQVSEHATICSCSNSSEADVDMPDKILRWMWEAPSPSTLRYIASLAHSLPHPHISLISTPIWLLLTIYSIRFESLSPNSGVVDTTLTLNTGLRFESHTSHNILHQNTIKSAQRGIRSVSSRSHSGRKFFLGSALVPLACPQFKLKMRS